MILAWLMVLFCLNFILRLIIIVFDPYIFSISCVSDCLIYQSLFTYFQYQFTLSILSIPETLNYWSLNELVYFLVYFSYIFGIWFCTCKYWFFFKNFSFRLVSIWFIFSILLVSDTLSCLPKNITIYIWSIYF